LVRWNPGPGGGALAWTIAGRPDPEFGTTFENIRLGLEKVADEMGAVALKIELFVMVLMRNYYLDRVDALDLLKFRRFPEHSGLLAWFAMIQAINKLVIDPVSADMRRVRAALPPLKPRRGRGDRRSQLRGPRPPLGFYSRGSACPTSYTPSSSSANQRPSLLSTRT
jgi:hypothetical protein